jgi:aldose 1-epimerase
LDDRRLSSRRDSTQGEQLAKWRYRPWQGGVVRSGVVTITLVVAALLIMAIGWHEHIRGHFGKLKRELKGPAPAVMPVAAAPGGQEPIVLERSTIEGGMVPELLSATFLPGRGMNLLQIKAQVPGRGEVDLLASPPVAEASSRLSGEGSDSNGLESLAMGAAVELPWAGSIYGPVTGNTVSASWNGRVIHLPAGRQGAATAARGGLLLREAATSMKMNVMPDGGEAVASYDADDLKGGWPSRTQVTMTALLSGHALEMKVTARNNGNEPEPVGIGWSPRFALLSGKREGLMLHIPSTTKLERNPHSGEPTGRLLAVTGTPYDFSGRPGAKVGSLELEDTFVNLHQTPLDNGPVVELRDPASSYGLRITVLSPSIKAAMSRPLLAEGM